MEIAGAKGSIAIEDVTRRVTLIGADPDQTESFQPNHFAAGDSFYDSVGDHVRSFIERVARGREPLVTGRDALRAAQLAAAAIDSHQQRRPIEV
jgi:predicted dehydrogenase